jgi:hypothetical protein
MTKPVMIIALVVAAAIAWTPAFSQSTGSSGSGPGGAASAPAPGSDQLMTKEGTVRSYDSATHMLTMEDGSTYLLSDKAIALMPNGPEIIRPGGRLAFAYFDQGGQKVISSIQSQVRP